MKAIVVKEFGEESVLHYDDAPRPEPGENEVGIIMKAAGVNPVETYIRSGNYGALPALPYIPGNDGAGLVDRLGPGVTGLAVGQRVFVAAALANRITGTYADYAVCDQDAVRPLPDNVGFAEGAGLGTPGLAATNALFARARVRAGETVLIHGASGRVGTLAVQLARRAGLIVFGTAGSPASLKLAEQVGAHRVFNHNEEGYLDKIVQASPAGGPDVIIEMLANVNLGKDLSIIAKHGRIVVIGNRGSLDFNPREAMVKDADVRGMLIGNMPRRDFVANMHILSAALENGLKVVVNRELPLAEAAEAHRLVIEGASGGKVILVNDQ